MFRQFTINHQTDMVYGVWNDNNKNEEVPGKFGLQTSVINH